MTDQPFNIAALAIAATATLHLKGTDNQLLFADKERTKPIRVHLHTPGSPAFAEVESLQSARNVKRHNDNEGKLAPVAAEDRIAETAEDLSIMTISFENFTYDTPQAAGLSGAPLFRAAYGDPAIGFITRQVSRFLNDWANFKPASATT